MTMATVGTFSAQGVTAGVAVPIDAPSMALLREMESAPFMLNVTATGGAGTDTLDVYVQHSVDGVVWDDFIHFTQLTVANAVATKVIANWVAEVIPSTPLKTVAPGTLAVGVQQGPTGEQVRLFLKVAGTTGTFTGSVVAGICSDAD